MPRSIRELLTIVAVLSLGCASLRAGGILAFAFSTLIALLVVAFAIIAFVARDTRQTFSIGFLVAFGLYGLTHVSIGNQLDPSSDSALVTTGMFEPLCERFCEQIWVNKATGEALSGFDPDLTSVRVPVGPGFHYISADGTTGVLTVLPTRATTVMVAHLIFASLLGYLGGRFALFVRRTDAENRNETRRTSACTEGREPSGLAIENSTRVLGDA